MRRGHRRTRLPVEYRQIFWSGQNVPRTFAIVGVRAVTRQKDIVALAVDGARSRFAGHLGNPVAVEVIHYKRRVMRPGADIVPQINTPQERPVEFIRIQIHITRIPGLRIILSIGRIPLDNDLIFPIAGQISDTAIAGAVGVHFAGRRHAVGRTLERNQIIKRRPDLGRLRKRTFYSVDDGADSIGAVGRRGVNKTGRSRDRRRRDTNIAAVNVIADVLPPFGPQHSPAHINLTAAGTHRNHTPSEIFHMTRGWNIRGGRPAGCWNNCKKDR